MFEDSGNIWDDAEKMAENAHQLYEDGDMDAAYKQLCEAIEINPGNPAWFFNAGLTLDALGQFEKAVDHFEKAMEFIGEDPEVLNCIAVDYTREGMYDHALEIFGRIQQIDPNFEPAYCNRIITYTEMDNHQKAEEMFYLAQQVNEDCPICFYNIGNSLFVRGKYEQAVKCWERTAQIDPEHPQIDLRIAQAYWASGNMDLARAHFIQELRQNPGDVEVVMDFGIFLLADSDVESAKEKFARTLEMQPDNATAMLYLGDIELNNSRSTLAKKWYNKARKADPTLSGPNYRLGQLAADENKPEDALNYFKDELDNAGNDPEILMSIGSILLGLGEIDYATDCFLNIVDNDPANGKCFMMIGKCLMMRDVPEPEGAIQFYEHAITNDYFDTEMIKHLAMIYLQTDRPKKAQKTFARILPLEDKTVGLAALSLRIKYHLLMEKTLGKHIDRLRMQTYMATTRIKCKLRRILVKFKK